MKHLSVFFIFLLTGCSSTLTNQEAFNQVEIDISERLDTKVLWVNSKETEDEMSKKVTELLKQELTPDSATKIALLNNRGVQATFEELGVARAEVMSAALFPNPLLSVSSRFPSGGGRTNFEFGITENFFTLLFLPLQKSIAESGLEAAKSKVSNEVLALASEVKTAFYELQGTLQDKELLKTVLAATEASYVAARQIHAAGNTTDLELQNEQVMYEQTKLELAKSETEIRQLREKLTTLLGLWGEGTNWTIAERLPEIPATEVDFREIEKTALTSRFDLASAKTQIEITGKTLGIAAPFAVFQGSELGLDTERDVDGQWVTGPNFALPIPIFPQGTAASARAEAQYKAALFKYYELAVQIRSETRAARDKLIGHQKQIEFMKKVMLPLRHSVVQQTQIHYNGMLLGLFALISAKQAEIEAGRSLVSEIKEYWKARTMLERAVGRVFPLERPEATTISSPDKTSQSQHEH